MFSRVSSQDFQPRFLYYVFQSYCQQLWHMETHKNVFSNHLEIKCVCFFCVNTALNLAAETETEVRRTNETKNQWIRDL